MTDKSSSPLDVLAADVRTCRLCADLPLGPRPILQVHADAKILVAGQAPGRRTHEKNRPFDDPSGDRLRTWLGVDRDVFYDETVFAFLPMGFCFPGTGKGGDLPPRPACATAWRKPLLAALENIQLTLLIGQYAHAWHLGDERSKTLSATVADWQRFWPKALPMPHPSPRNTRWLKQNAFFEEDVVPMLQGRIREILDA